MLITEHQVKMSLLAKETNTWLSERAKKLWDDANGMILNLNDTWEKFYAECSAIKNTRPEQLTEEQIASLNGRREKLLKILKARLELGRHLLSNWFPLRTEERVRCYENESQLYQKVQESIKQDLKKIGYYEESDHPSPSFLVITPDMIHRHPVAHSQKQAMDSAFAQRHQVDDINAEKQIVEKLSQQVAELVGQMAAGI